jgi:hypothetical protein
MIPKPIKTSERNCFGIAWFQTEAEAEAYSKYIWSQGKRYNGGWLDGQRCGREASFDYEDKELGKLYAVTN